MIRRKSREIKIGNLYMGGNNPVVIQSMTNTFTKDADATIKQILELEKEGCQLVRVTVNNEEAAEAIKKIKKGIHIPLVADIHFDYKLAVRAIENGIDKLRINPGNIGDDEKVRLVVETGRKSKRI